MCFIESKVQTTLLNTHTCIEIHGYTHVGHRCAVSGCGETIVIDGNMKNHRDVCLATKAGYAEYHGLPGKVTTGCINTPDFKSRYCSLHKPTVTASDSLKSGTSEKDDEKESQVGMILSKRTTRNQTMYQVLAT